MNNKQKQSVNKKDIKNNRKYFGRLIFFVVIAIFILFAGRFFYISVIHRADGQDLQKKVAKLYDAETRQPAKRGTIYDSNQQPVAEDTTTYSIYIVLSKKATYNGKIDYLPDSKKRQAASVLSKNLNISYQKVWQTLNPKNKDLYQVELGSPGKNISLETKKTIAKSKIPGIKFIPSQSRLYPNGKFASHLVGLAENTEGKLEGVMGLEKEFNKKLKGVDGVKKSSFDSQGTDIPGRNGKSRKVKNGDDIYTTIDQRLQNYLESLTNKASDKYHPKGVRAMLMNAKSGEIIAATQRPTFNPQTREGINDIWRNTLLEDAYEPGSTMKIFTTAAAINSGNFNPNATYHSGSYEVDKQKIYDWNKNGWGTIDYQQAFIRSSNVGMAHLEQQMGPDKWKDYLDKFGFLKSTKAGLGDESSGSISYKYPIDQVNTSYGQGIDVTAFQMMQGFSAIANDGKMVKPRLISQIKDPNTGKTVYSSKPTTVGHPIKKETSKQVLNLMERVVTDKNGTGQDYKLNNYPVAVKTGTAQIANENGSGYMNGDTNYTFSVAGIAPANDPKYVLYVTMERPKSFSSEGTATKMLSTIFNPLMQRTLDDEANESKVSMQKIDNMNGMDTNDATEKLEKQGLKVEVVGSGDKIKRQSQKPGAKVIKGERVILVTDKRLTMPDFSGWSQADIVNFGQMVGLKIKITGSGYGAKQSVDPGKDLTSVKSLEVNLQSH
ncbi:penicillin-binding transpeptidase domain-containing protein [Ligilactobacillus pobuzihii]|uniref:Penicillin binding protein 2B n=1 Tax=Ligilactobacillus pobuzihii TaxID=449659 RepID=A0A0R2LGT1_9LACO|nr:penicillin-binding transpeptidase domain-containing protein [Ligilactobacillus pobuzihii]KRK10844.1 penicillin binding protein 2B [Ligilactobacillus pobuzihii E100301 = KCTC 13174]KRO01060.1 penicillin binding protein 2B [Ligilactobacillus pobuzihii]